MDLIYSVIVELDQAFIKKTKKSKTQIAKDLAINFGESFAASFSANAIGYPTRGFTEPYGVVLDDAVLTGLAFYVNKHYIMKGSSTTNTEILKRILYKLIAREVWKWTLNTYGNDLQYYLIKLHKQKQD